MGSQSSGRSMRPGLLILIVLVCACDLCVACADVDSFQNQGGISISTDGHLVVYGCGRQAFVWDRRDGVVRQLKLNRKGTIAACELAPNRTHIAVSVAKTSLLSGVVLLFDRQAKLCGEFEVGAVTGPDNLGFLSGPVTAPTSNSPHSFA